MNAIDLLTDDHRRIEHLFARYEELGERDVLDRICRELTTHTLVEERLLYPLVRDRLPDGPVLAEAGITDHELVKALVDELRHGVRRHIEDEERLVLPRLREIVGEDALDGLGARMEQECAPAVPRPRGDRT